MSEDLDLEVISKKSDEEAIAKSPLLRKSFKNQKTTDAKKELYREVFREEQTVLRQDYLEYKFDFASICQAIAIILGFIMMINFIIFLSSGYGLSDVGSGITYLSWIMFGQSGFLLLLSGLAIPRRSVVVEQRSKRSVHDKSDRKLRFAFVHSLTYFIAGICMAVISTFVHNIL
jgi:hypothetical protein